MFLTNKKAIDRRRKSGFRPVLTALLGGVFAVSAFSQQTPPTAGATQTTRALTSAEFVGADGLTVEKLIELGGGRRADLLAARQRLVIAEGRLRQARFRPNPTLEAEYGSARFLGGAAETDFAAGLSQTFELGGKREKRVAVAELELRQARAELLGAERRLAAEIRQSYTGAVASARQLDVLEKLVAADEEIVRVTEARLSEGDAAPLDLNLVRVETNRLKIQIIAAKNDLETQLLNLRTLIGADVAETIKLAAQPEKPPRLDVSLSELTKIALVERADLQAAAVAEQLGAARVDLARAGAVPNVAASVRFSREKSVVDLPAPLVGSSADRSNKLTFGVAVDLPIFNRNQGEIGAALGERAQAARSREFLESIVKRDVAVAYRKYRAAAEALVLYSTQILPRAEENLRTVRAAYGLGEFSIFEVVGEQRRLIENVTGYNQALRDYYNALTEIETVVGAPLPASGFAPGASSVLPDDETMPRQTDKEKILKALDSMPVKTKRTETARSQNR